MTEYEAAAQCCPRCRYTFRTLADEWGTHPCPRCNYDPVPFDDEEGEEDEDAS